MKTPTAAIIYGFCEGKRIATKFENSLAQAGFVVIEDPAKADVIVAHSGGCYLVPADATAKLVMFVGVPFWPQQSLPRRLLRKIRLDAALHWQERAMRSWLAKTSWNAWYFWRMPTHIRMLRLHKSDNAFVPNTARLILVQNKDDAPVSPRVLTAFPRAAFCELPGQHDDLWDNPEPYVAIVRKSLLQ